MISVRSVSKVFRQGDSDIRALDGVSLSVGGGEFVTVVGPSGSGKSTLLHLIGGLDRPTAGTVTIAGTDVARGADDQVTIFRRRKIGVVFQFFNLLPTLTAEENVALPLVLDGLRRREAAPRAVAALERVGLSHRRRHRPDALSGGEMQRVAIARALVVDPLIVLADEPTGNLDSRTGEQVLALLRAANTAGATVVLVTHDARAAASGSRRIMIEDGRIVEDTAAGP
jgi:putative ABC transport system ATP-binding protein